MSKNFYMYMESGERVEIFSSQNFDFYFQILENTLLNGFECRVSPFFPHTSIDAVYFGSYTMTFACGTAYLIRPTESNNPACGYLAMALGHLSQC